MYQLNLPKKVYFKSGSMKVALRELTEVYHLKRALLVSDVNLYRGGAVKPVKLWLNDHGMRTAEFFSIDGEPSFEDIRSVLPKALEFQPDAIVGVGGGNAMSAAKALWALYENPELDLAAAVAAPALLHTGEKAQLCLVATSFGSGLQNAPFAVLRDDDDKLVQLKSQCLLPLISSTDADFTASLTKQQVRKAAGETLAQSLRALAAPDCCEYTAGLLCEAVKAILHYLAYAESGCPVAREKLHNAAAIAGSAYGNLTLPDDPRTRMAPMADDQLAAVPRIGLLAQDLGYADAAALVAACGAIYHPLYH